MIKINIIESLDYDSLGEFEFKLNQFTIGDKNSSHLVLFDPWIIKYSLRFHIKKNKLFITSSEQGSFYVNSVKFKGSKKVNEGDILKFGKTKIKIIGFQSEYEQDVTLTEFITRMKNDLKNTDNAYLNLINEVEDQIANIEIKNEY